MSDERVFSNADAWIADGSRAGIEKFVLGGVCPEEWERQVSLKKRYPAHLAMVWGLHPVWVHEQADRPWAFFERALEKLQGSAQGLSGIGEIGLDQIQGKRAASRPLQEKLMRLQLQIAKQSGKPIVLHVVRAHSEALEILRSEANQWKGLVHSFAADMTTAQRYLELGLTLSISGRVTYENAHALRATVREVPVEALVFETDSPDQPPLGLTTDHTPQSLIQVVEEVARLRGCNAAELADQSRVTLERIFDWNPK